MGTAGWRDVNYDMDVRLLLIDIYLWVCAEQWEQRVQHLREADSELVSR